MESFVPACRRLGCALGGAWKAMFTPETPRDAGSISYFSLFAIFPAILVLIAIVDAFLGWLQLHNRVMERIVVLFPGSREFLEANLREITEPSPALFISCVVVILWSSTWIFASVENSLNRAWQVERKRSFWESRIRSVALMTLGGILLLISAIVTGAVATLRADTTDHIPPYAQDQIINWMWSSVLLTATFLIAIVVFFCIYKLMPERQVTWREAFSGAIVAAALWEAGSYIFAKLVPLFDSQMVYGRTGAIIMLLAWVYTSTLIMLFGAHFSAKLHDPALDQSEVPAALAESGAEKRKAWRADIRPISRQR